MDALERLRRATLSEPWRGRLWLVGGAVRDPLLGLPMPSDLDVVVEGDAPALARELYENGVASAPPVPHERFGISILRLGEAEVELASPRADTYAPLSRKPAVRPATLEEDARRRDFTVNTLLRNLHTGELRDPLGTALADLEARRLRTPGDPVRTMSEDPLRTLRAVRFVHQLGFTLAPELEEAIRATASRLSIVSAERIRGELELMLGRPTAAGALRDLMDLGLLGQFAPELAAMRGVEQGSYHDADVWEHTLRVVDRVARGDVLLVLAALLHDVGKPATRSVDAEGRVRFFGHETVGEQLARALLARLRFPSATVERVALHVRHHMRLCSKTDLSPAAARRLIRDLGEELERFLDLVEADAAALRPGVKVLDMAAIRARLDEVRRETPPDVLVSPLTGDQIMEVLGLGPGPEVGRAKAWLTERVIEGELAPGDEEGARRMLMAQWSRPSSEQGEG